MSDDGKSSGNGKEVDMETFENLTTIMVHFMEQAMKTAGVYVKHCERKVITVEDIKRSLMLEMFLFKNRKKDIGELNQIKKDIFEKSSDDEDDVGDDYSDLIDEEGENDAFTESECKCETCKCLNNIYEKWEKFVPQNNIEIIMKNHIENIENESFF